LRLNKTVIATVELFFNRIFKFRQRDVLGGADYVPKISLYVMPFLLGIQVGMFSHAGLPCAVGEFIFFFVVRHAFFAFAVVFAIFFWAGTIRS
jgi:hypothetical protein